MGLFTKLGKSIDRGIRDITSHWEYLGDITLVFFSKPSPHLRISYSACKIENVPKWLTGVNISCGTGSSNYCYINGKHFSYKIVYSIPSKNWEGEPQNFGHLYDDNMPASIYRKEKKH
jgi:hypothetical protein